MKNLTIYYIIFITSILYSDLYSQNCIGKDFSRAEWFTKDSIISNVSEYLSKTIENIVINNDELRIVDNSLTAVENVELYDLEGKKLDFSYSIISESDNTFLIKSDMLNALKSNIYFIAVQTSDIRKYYKILKAE